MPEKIHFASLDGLRGLAAILVLLHHSIDPYGASRIRAGLAVDFFFLLSGFVIAYAYEGKLLGNKLSAWSFVLIRVIRLYPLAFLGFACGAFVFGMKSFASHQPLGLPFVVSILCGVVAVPSPVDLAPGWASAFPFNPPSWSLFFEFFINVVYVMTVRLLTRGLLKWVLIVSGAALLFQDLLAGGAIGNWNTLYMGFFRVTFPFFLGIFLFRLDLRNHIRRLKGGAVLISALLLATLLFPATRFDVAVEIASVFVVFPVIVVFGAVSEPPAWAKQTFLLVGQLSYPLYILHYPFVHLFGGYLRAHHLSGFPLCVGIAVECLVAIGFSLAVMKWVDKPVRDLLSRAFVNRSRRSGSEPLYYAAVREHHYKT